MFSVHAHFPSVEMAGVYDLAWVERLVPCAFGDRDAGLAQVEKIASALLLDWQCAEHEFYLLMSVPLCDELTVLLDDVEELKVAGGTEQVAFLRVVLPALPLIVLKHRRGLRAMRELGER